MSNINDNFFDGFYKKIWRDLIPDELTSKEIDFIIPNFHLGPGTRVLDLMCGYGRHALGLGRKGIEVMAIDNLQDYVDEINETARKEKLPVKAIRQDILGYKAEGQFDLAICMGNSLQFFERKDVIAILRSVQSSLKPGGHLLINSWSIAEIAIKNFRERNWSEIGGLKFLVSSVFQPAPARIEINSIIITPSGETEEKSSVDYIYSLNEMESMLREAGLALDEVYSVPGKKKFTIGEPRAYLFASKL